MSTISKSQESLYIKPTKTLPEVRFLSDGCLSISGKMVNDYLITFFNRLFPFIENLSCPNVIFTIDLEYINTTGVFLLVEMFKRLEQNKSVKNIDLIWHYDEDDEEHYDIGCLLRQGLKRSKLHFHSIEANDTIYDIESIFSSKNR